jgi:ABC transport system ATP-binding/permease protein
MKRFWFDGDAQFAPIGTLSGGERRRLQLLLTLVEQPNVLLLDEPTNDLDLDTLRALEDLLDDWPGIVLVVSHDRAFLDRTIDELFALDGRGGIRPVRGGIAGWLADRAALASASAASSAPARTPAMTPSRPRQPAPMAAGALPTRSPSTIRRQLGQAERSLAAASEVRDGLNAQLAAATEHMEMARLGGELTRAQAAMDAAEEVWLDLATEAEVLGLGT